MKGFLLNVKKFLTLDISSKKDNNKVKKSLRDKWETFKIDCSLNKLKISYFISVILLSFLLAYTLVNFTPLSNDEKAYIGFSIFYIAFSVMISPIIYNLLLTIVLFFSSIFAKAEEKTENKADETTIELKNSVIPINHYLFTFIAVYFPSFLILFCMKFTGVNWRAVYYMCATFIVAFSEIEFLVIASYLLLELTRDKACHYNLKYNTVK